MALTYTRSDFLRKLQKINSSFRFIYGPLEVSGIYVINPRHAKAKPNGLVHVGAMPSPRHFLNIPQWDFRTDLFLDTEGNPRAVKGWNSVLDTLRGHGVITRRVAKKHFPAYWDGK